MHVFPDKWRVCASLKWAQSRYESCQTKVGDKSQQMISVWHHDLTEFSRKHNI